MNTDISSSDDYDSIVFKDAIAKPVGYGSTSPAIVQTSALLSIWSVLVITEGALRVVTSNPSVGLFDAGRPPRFVPFLGGLFEVTFGLLGLFIGLNAFILRQYDTRFIKISMIIQTVLGYYVFAVFVFIIPSMQAVDLEQPLMEGLNFSQSRLVIVMGMFTSFHFCLALQGGQFLFMARLVSVTSGADFLFQNSGNKMRAIFWNANLALAGVWTLIAGGVINANVGTGRLDQPFIAPPHIGVLPVFTIVTGIIMICLGAFAVHLARNERTPSPLYYVLWAALYLLCYLNFTIVQLGYIDAEGSDFTGGDGAAALHGGLVFMVTLLGPYFVNLAARERNGHAL